LSPDEVIDFFNSCNPSSSTMALGFTQPLKVPEDISGIKARPASKADNLTAIYRPTV
jgi:hypothetical protein